MSSALSSQRFCLRWNNHQSNLLSVFDQLLHDESFVDVTLAVEGRFLRAHKMVLSACSPYFQALFVGHPDKHPIVILKDVPYCDMRSLLDFMYRGEVSVDQDRLTAFLKVAESLRIKGLTEVNEEKCDLPSITSSLLSAVPPPVVTTHTPPPPHLHRIHPTSSHKRSIPMPSAPSATSSNPLLGSALTAPKRKRGRPRKLSGSSGGAPATTPGLLESATSSGSSSRHQTAVDGNGDVENSPRLSTNDSLVAQGSPELLEVKMSGMEFQHSPAGNSGTARKSSDGENGSGTGPSVSSADEAKTTNKDSAAASHSKQVKEEPEPTPGPSSQDPGQAFVRPSSTNDPEQYALDPIILPKSEVREDGEGESEGGGGGNGGGEGVNSPIGGEQQQPSVPPGSSSAPPPARPPIKRRARRRATSASQDPAEQLTEMSVRGLNLFRYASISEGVYKCTECAKSDVQKTFKNKYSFQRHAFLYHEGHQRKVFPCPVCSKEFSRPDKMKNHMKTVHDCFMPKDCVFPIGFFLPH
ncbi:protein tramtrack, alpha isoform isoform X8 [Periplaneta americana]|uniref:protein tramtrack, alpha isoform isoform X8 n=1 Tax=Periplaneta americana TaxID=6978 RepID=UPI0037E9C39B